MFWNLSAYIDLALVILRVSLGCVFFSHAWPKIVRPQWVVGEDGASGMVHVFRFIGLCEAAGAVALGAGFLSQLAALGLSILIALAIPVNIFAIKAPFSSHAPKIGGWDLPLALLGATILLLVTGPGRYAVDAMR